MGRVNYIHGGHARPSQEAFYVNVLRKFHAPAFTGYAATAEYSVFSESLEEIPTWNDMNEGGAEGATFGEQFTPTLMLKMATATAEISTRGDSTFTEVVHALTNYPPNILYCD